MKILETHAISQQQKLSLRIEKADEVQNIKYYAKDERFILKPTLRKCNNIKILVCHFVHSLCLDPVYEIDLVRYVNIY